MSGRTQGDRKLSSPAVNAITMPNDVPSMSSPVGERRSRPRAGRFLRWYYAVKYRPFRRERRPHDGRRGLIALQIDALAYADLRRAMELGFTPTLPPRERGRVHASPLVLRAALRDAVLPGRDLSR